MATRFIAAGLVAAVLCASTAFGATDQPVDMRIRWKPGETLRYQVDMSADARGGGESSRMTLSALVSIRVLEAGEKSVAAKAADPQAGGRLTTGEPLIDAEVRYEQITQTLSLNGRDVVVRGDKNGVRVTVDGNSVPGGDTKPLRDLLNSRIRLTMTTTGRVVSVSGLESLDPKLQEQTAKDFFDAMLLPPKPLRVGETYGETREMPSFASGGSASTSGKTIQLTWTLADVRSGPGGKTVAVLRAPLRQKYDDVEMDGGARGSVEIDTVTTRTVDVATGTTISEEAKGRVLARPRQAGMPDLVTVDVEARVTLVETPRDEVARATERN